MHAIKFEHGIAALDLKSKLNFVSDRNVLSLNMIFLATALNNDGSCGRTSLECANRDARKIAT